MHPTAQQRASREDSETFIEIVNRPNLIHGGLDCVVSLFCWIYKAYDWYFYTFEWLCISLGHYIPMQNSLTRCQGFVFKCDIICRLWQWNVLCAHTKLNVSRAVNLSIASIIKVVGINICLCTVHIFCIYKYIYIFKKNININICLYLIQSYIHIYKCTYFLNIYSTCMCVRMLHKHILCKQYILFCSRVRLIAEIVKCQKMFYFV